MRYYKKLDTSMSFLLAIVLATLPSCSADVSGTGAPVGSVTVSVTPTMLSVGGVAQASATANDTAGKPIPAPTVSWSSLTPAVAAVDSSGGVKGLASGSALIQGTVGGKTGTATVAVGIPPDLASHDFNDGTLGPTYTYPYTQAPADLDFPADPTGSGRGKVARFHYHRASPTDGSADRNRAIQLTHPVTYGQTMYFKGDFYFAFADLDMGMYGLDLPDATIARKLLYWQMHDLQPKYGAAERFSSILLMQGHHLDLWISNDVGTVVFAPLVTLSGNTWYTVEKQLTNQSAPGVADGTVKIWLNGALIYSNTAISFFPPSWIGIPVPGGNAIPLDAADMYFEGFLVGQQVNYNNGAYDEYRYWDNVSFSTQRIGK